MALEKIKLFINAPFPDSCDLNEVVKEFIPIALFVSAFLFFFRPFGIQYSEGPFLLICFAYGLITYVIGIAYEVFQLSVLKIDKESPEWTFGKWIISTLILVLLIAIGNYLLSFAIGNNNQLSFSNLLVFVVYTLSIGIFPIVIMGLIRQLKNQKQNDVIASEISVHHSEIDPVEKGERINIPSLNENEILQLDPAELLYLEAMENYVAVHYLNGEVPTKKLVRNTLKAVSEVLPENLFLRCHRSFVVNLRLIQEVEGNAQGLKLGLQNVREAKVPVSRKYISILKERI
ncbi:MAG: LytTR family DNA-binding domain-containing protein [Bacteroidota bacterium]